MATSREWVLLAYRIPREPSTPRIAVWRKLRRLGVVQILDGLVGLPHDARTKEHLEWIADEVLEAGGEASIFLAHPSTKAHERALAAQMADEIDAQYDAIVDDAKSARSASDVDRRRTHARLGRELKAVRNRDHFPKRGFERARAAVQQLGESLGDEISARR